jgi:hypothetical protein
LRYPTSPERIANRTVAEEYFNVTAKVEALYDARQPAQLPADDEGHQMRKLRGEMYRRMLGNGYCARPVQLDCHFESICESCTFFVTSASWSRNASRSLARQGPSISSRSKRSGTTSGPGICACLPASTMAAGAPSSH